MSTEATVRATLVAAIQAIAQTKLGFDLVNGNVREYPLEAHHDEAMTGYLMAKVGSVQLARCWAVDVIGRDVPLATGNITRRTYEIRVIGYYARGRDGEGYLALIDGGTAVRGAIRGLNSNLSGTVDLVSAASQLDITERDGANVGKFWQGVMTYTAERANPVYP